MARTDSRASEGLDAAIARARAYADAGADAIFPEALQDEKEFETFRKAVDLPLLANITEFGKTPLFTVEELREAGVRLALYPLSAFRAMSAAALAVFGAVRAQGTQRSEVERMQPRTELYEVLDYYAYERKLDELFASEESSDE
jgi:methylisocitrate lyase